MLALTKFFSFALILTVAIQSAVASLVTTTGNASTSIAGPLTLNSGTDALQTATNSSNDCLVGLSASLVTVLDADPDLAGYCYGEDPLNGWIGVSYEPIELRYNAYGSDGLPIATDIFVDNFAIATISFPPNYVGSHFGLIYQGDVYCGTVTEQDIYFTAVPEPSTAGITMGAVALCAWNVRRRSHFAFRTTPRGLFRRGGGSCEPKSVTSETTPSIHS